MVGHHLRDVGVEQGRTIHYAGLLVRKEAVRDNQRKELLLKLVFSAERTLNLGLYGRVYVRDVNREPETRVLQLVRDADSALHRPSRAQAALHNVAIEADGTALLNLKVTRGKPQGYKFVASAADVVIAVYVEIIAFHLQFNLAVAVCREHVAAFPVNLHECRHARCGSHAQIEAEVSGFLSLLLQLAHHLFIRVHPHYLFLSESEQVGSSGH